ncbi:hypothetical protein BDV40DRAFT_282789 [Aspergillus tamarii]|uniref:Uncharacterized protein n=1 Tax=Aspergillus tamarii TaxID=41984 RepID=A0A5N6UB73_ASPTM|nr:hypothetical protein BDV40DRAFT_282789 [Aspergillus tamarii]
MGRIWWWTGQIFFFLMPPFDKLTLLYSIRRRWHYQPTAPDRPLCVRVTITISTTQKR